MDIDHTIDDNQESSSPEAEDAGAAHLRSILATVPDAMVVIDEKGRILSFSSAAERMFGFTQDEVAGENVSILMASPDRERHDAYIDHYHETGERRVIGVGRVTTARRRDGSTFPIELAVGEAETPRGRVFTGFIRDLTETRQAERRLHDLQSELAHVSRVSAIGTLAAALAHELNQPLTAITNYVEAARDLLRDQPDREGILENALGEAAKQSLRAGQIVRRLRDFIARGDVEKTTNSLKKLVTEANALALVGIGAAEVDVAIDFDPATDLVLVDRVQIQQVFMNLVRNALEAVAQAPIKRIEIKATAVSNSLIEVSISDSGTGLSEEAARTLFEPFRSTKETGMGLGLSICQGGRIWVQPSRLGGSVFHFTLMRAPALL
jgi:two-component system, LuxR family, sensor kinase FixL